VGGFAQWEKVVMNLMSNAFKFTFDGEVKVSLRAVDGQVLFSVSDTGVGIPEAELGRVFERFHRVEGTRGRSFEGSGIGLALVYEIVKRHGGTVQVSSSVGKGTSFVVALQLGTQHLPSDKLVSEPTQAIRASDGRSATMAEARRWLAGANTQPPTEGPAKGHGMADAADSSLGISVRAGKVSGRVLIADDNADMREYLTQLVSEHWQTTLAVNGKQALELALKDPPDLVLSDVMMPEMDGVALLNALRTDPRTATVPVILISARAGEEERLAGLETGADDYVLKPFSAREVLTRIRTHLEMAKVRRGAAAAAQVLADTRAGLLERLEQEHATLQRTLAELQHTQAQLVQSAKMASLGELVAGIAHEINNPLAFGSSHLNTIQRSLTTIAPHIEQRLPEEAMPAWERARARLTETQVALNRIRELVLQLRTFSRLDEGERKQIDLAEAVESVLTILAHRFGDRITIKKRLSEPREIDCYAGLFNQAVMNLVANAIEAIEGPGEIEIESRMRDNWFELTVSDTGTGVPEPLRDRIFEPFFTTKPVGQGTGLGLAITYSIAQKHGGSVRLVPREVRGTVAELRFPVQAGASSRD
jgi:signal transduction histidine kinase